MCFSYPSEAFCLYLHRDSWVSVLTRAFRPSLYSVLVSLCLISEIKKLRLITGQRGKEGL